MLKLLSGRPLSGRPAVPIAMIRWLYVVAALIVLIVVVGGITRLTESGLSITQWKPITGIVPPLDRRAVAGRVRQLPRNSAICRSSTRA